jgi:hypothetical protein
MAQQDSLKIHLAAVGLAAVLGVLFSHGVHVDAASFLPLPGTQDLDVPAPVGETAVQKAENILGPLAQVARVIMGAVAVLLIVIAGFRMVVSGDNEETVKSQREAITYTMIGLLMLSIAGPIAQIFDYRQGNLLENSDTLLARAQIFDDTTQIVISFIKYLLGALATLMMVSSGALLIGSSNNEDDVGRAKKNLVLSGGGLLLVVVSDLAVRKIFYNASFSDSADSVVIALDQNELLRQMVGATNILVGFVGPVLMLALVAGAILYIVAGDDEEKTGLAKKIILNSVIGIVIIYGAYSIVSTIIGGVF